MGGGRQGGREGGRERQGGREETRLSDVCANSFGIDSIIRPNSLPPLCVVCELLTLPSIHSSPSLPPSLPPSLSPSLPLSLPLPLPLPLPLSPSPSLSPPPSPPLPPSPSPPPSLSLRPIYLSSQPLTLKSTVRRRTSSGCTMSYRTPALRGSSLPSDPPSPSTPPSPSFNASSHASQHTKYDVMTMSSILSVPILLSAQAVLYTCIFRA